MLICVSEYVCLHAHAHMYMFNASNANMHVRMNMHACELIFECVRIYHHKIITSWRCLNICMHSYNLIHSFCTLIIDISVTFKDHHVVLFMLMIRHLLC